MNEQGGGGKGEELKPFAWHVVWRALDDKPSPILQYQAPHPTDQYVVEKTPLYAIGPAAIRAQARAEALEDAEECREIISSLIDSIRRHGNYTEASTLMYLGQALACLHVNPHALAAQPKEGN